MQNSYSQESPVLIEKVIASLSYLTFSLVGFVWLIIGVITKNQLRPFLKYHIFQSIFLAMAYYLCCALLGIVMDALSLIPFVNQIILRFTYYLNAPFVFGFSTIQLAIYAVMAYLIFTSCRGKYSYVPWVSDIIKANV